MRTASLALLFSSTLAAPAFAGRDGAAVSFRESDASRAQPDDALLAQTVTGAAEGLSRHVGTQG
ncbi:hypothetical protein P3T18_001979 [Paraburkholderia sp. GAS199]|uniref:hypothetical protein n=1 Tax=Paraburkholderia sp. GAS199 TaxID=3035126 RepID=UPI003D236906